MNSLSKTCKQCKEKFEITEKDEAFYKSIDVPSPTLCPFCRMIRRLSYRKERFLHNRNCDISGKQIISAYPKISPINRPTKMFPVYDVDEWWSDKWDPLAYGRDFDFSKPFFEQFFELQSDVPRMAVIQQKPIENSRYCNAASRLKNCYLTFSTNQCEDCYYGSWVNLCKNCIDSLSVQNCDFCYDCIYCRYCYECFFCQDSKNCSNSWFLKNCIACKDCFMCVNLNQKQYCIFNKQYSKDEYFKKLKEFDLGSRKSITQAKETFKKMCENSFAKYYIGTSIENSTGNYLKNTKNCHECFELDDCEDCSHSQTLNKAKNAMDHSYWGENSELTYECQACGYDLFNLKFCNLCWTNCSNLTYCDNCFSSQNCFGCIGLKKQTYCIFNKKYSKEEYEKLVPKIIEYMKQDGSWGEFFPEKYSPFAYNESLAYEHLNLTKEEALSRGWQWINRDEEYDYQGPKIEIPDNISEIEYDESQPDLAPITKQILTCTDCGKLYKIIPQELAFYKRYGIPVPNKCADSRHFDRIALRNPRKLWDRNCDNCKKNLKTSYSPERKEHILCEECYFKEV